MYIYIYINICPLLLTVIAKVFRQADTEETGHVDVSHITSLAAAVLGGQNIKESEKALIKFHSDSKKGICTCMNDLAVFIDFSVNY